MRFFLFVSLSAALFLLIGPQTEQRVGATPALSSLFLIFSHLVRCTIQFDRNLLSPTGTGMPVTNILWDTRSTCARVTEKDFCDRTNISCLDLGSVLFFWPESLNKLAFALQILVCLQV